MKRLTFVLISLIVMVVSMLVAAAIQGNESILARPVIKEGKSLALNQWSPQKVLAAQADAPKVSAKSAIFLETTSGEILYSKDINDKLPIASLVKVMTATVAMENRSLDDKLLVSPEAAEMEPDKMILQSGERLTVKELLYGIFLVSANDAAEVLAEDTTGNRAQFIDLMNQKASELGMKNTHYVNPTGLDEDSGSSYSSAYDLALLTRYAIHKFPALVEASSTDHIIIPATADHQDYEMYSGINLLTTYPGVVGFKTGYTPEAGLTLITLARKNGHEIIGVLLGSDNRREEARELLDYSFRELNP